MTFTSTIKAGAVLAEMFKTRPCAEWRERLRDRKITFSVVATMEDVIDDPQALQNDMFIKVEGHSHGRGQAVNSPFWIQGSDKVSAHLGSELGADSAAILRELGYSEDRIGALAPQGVIEMHGRAIQ
jgi:crotonobetainyl-CoA:carnitine CoA-transferase CaiB-like acyl-CoA transferase